MILNNIHLWIGTYLKQKVSHLFKQRTIKGPVHIIFCFVDHFEPAQQTQVDTWVEQYPDLASKHCDADGIPPQHTFFYPAEIYQAEHLETLSGLCRKRFGEVEVHLHHDNDTPQTLREKLEKAKVDYTRHGLLAKEKGTGATRYGFIHGNWALNNSRPDGRWCGVNDETLILKETGCYADFTFPSAPSETQPQKINSIYYDIKNTNKPKSHNHGVDVAAGKAQENRLLLVEGPLTFNWRRRKWGIIPRIENSDVTDAYPATHDRIDLWIDQKISVQGRPEWIFVKVHTHGAREKIARSLLGEDGDNMFSYLESRYNDGKSFCLHYVTAREMYNIIKAAEANENGNPNQCRDYLLVPFHE